MFSHFYNESLRKLVIGFGSLFDMGTHHKLLTVTNVALKSCASFKLLLGHLVSDR